ncbi:MAG TPA: hypothetical protein VHC18_14235 [Amycolatopsis sp.]|jgi:hypothetical protein|nr:hypothetical protein [Amycolatopsis sp.]
MQSTIARPEIPAAERVSRLGRLRTRAAKRIYLMAAVIGGVVAGSAPAYAVGSSTDLTGGAGDTLFTSLTDYFKGHVLVSVLLLLAVLLGAGMLISWTRRVAHSK